MSQVSKKSRVSESRQGSNVDLNVSQNIPDNVVHTAGDDDLKQLLEDKSIAFKSDNMKSIDGESRGKKLETEPGNNNPDYEDSK